MKTAPKIPAMTGPGLKREGIVVLQSFFIALFTWLEITVRHEPGIISGLILLTVTYGGIAYGRQGTRYVSAVTPPLAYAATILVYTIMHIGFKLSSVAVDFVAFLAAVAPYMVIAAIYGWFQFLNEKARNRPSKRKSKESSINS